VSAVNNKRILGEGCLRRVGGSAAIAAEADGTTERPRHRARRSRRQELSPAPTPPGQRSRGLWKGPGVVRAVAAEQSHCPAIAHSQPALTVVLRFHREVGETRWWLPSMASIGWIRAAFMVIPFCRRRATSNRSGGVAARLHFARVDATFGCSPSLSHASESPPGSSYVPWLSGLPVGPMKSRSTSNCVLPCEFHGKDIRT